MRFPALFAVVAAIASVSCAQPEARPVAAVPATVGCGDSAALRQTADADRRFRSASKSDQEKIQFGVRARLFASLANIADFRCRLPQADVEATLTQALDAARQAQDTAGFYEQTRKWTEADDMAGAVIAGLIAHLPPAAAK